MLLGTSKSGYCPLALSIATPRARGHAGVLVTGAQVRESTFGLSLSKAEDGRESSLM